MNNKILKMVVAVICFLFLFGCESNDINICDYKSIEIDREYVELTQEDIETIILLDFSSAEYYQLKDDTVIKDEDIILIDMVCDDMINVEDYYYEIGNEDILENLDEVLIGKKINHSFYHDFAVDGKIKQVKIITKGIYELPCANDEGALKSFYSYETTEEVYDFIRSRAKEEIIFNFMWEQILNNSKVIEFPTDIKNMINETKKNYSKYDNENISETEITQNIYNHYYELTIATAILDKEGVGISNVDIEDKKLELSETNDIAIEEISKYFSENDLYYIVVMNKLKSVLISYAKIID